MKQLLTKITANPKQLLLIDSMGAILTAFSLGVILTRFESIFGMPSSVLYVLSMVACGFAVYSFCCYLLVNKKWRPFLMAISIANLLYCCATFVLVLYFWEKLTFWGIGYFLLEIIIIVILVIIELKATAK